MKLLLALLAAIFIWIGSQKLISSLSFGKAATYGIEEFIQDRPEATSVELTGASMDVTLAIYSKSGKVKEAYVPAIPASTPDQQKIFILMATKDPDILKVIEETEELGDDKLIAEYMAANLDRVFLKQSITGRVRKRDDINPEDAKNLLLHEPNLSEDFVVIDTIAKPNWLAVALLPAGLVILGIAIFWKPAGEDEEEESDRLEDLDL